MTYWIAVFDITFTKKCRKKIERLCGRNKSLEEKLREALRDVAENPYAVGKKMKGYSDYIRCYVGYRHRLVYRVIGNTVTVFDFDTRENIFYG